MPRTMGLRCSHRTVGTLALLALVALLAPARPSHAQSAPLIAFARGNPNPDLWVMDENGGHARQVTSGLRVNNPTWSPDRRKIAFADSFNGNGILAINLKPFYFPDGFESVQQDGSPVRLTDSSAQDLGPEWGPPTATAPGGRIAFFSNRSGSRQIWVVTPNVDPATQKVIPGNSPPVPFTSLNTLPQEHAQWPSWSPDGTMLAFCAPAPDGVLSLYIMDATASNPLTITPRPLQGAPEGMVDIEWGTSVVAGSAIAGYSIGYSLGKGVAVIPVSGTWPNLSAGSPQLLVGGNFPTWSPNGDKLAFAGPGGRNDSDIWWCFANGASPTDLTNNSKDEGRPAWSK